MPFVKPRRSRESGQGKRAWAGRNETSKFSSPEGSLANVGPGARILGLDPGSRHTGFGWIERRAGCWRLGASGSFSPARNRSRAERLGELHQGILELIGNCQPLLVAVERPFVGVSARAALALAEARGAVLAALGAAGLPVLELTPAEVKLSVAGYGRAGKEQVGRMVHQQLDLPQEGYSADALDALAIAVAAASRIRWRGSR